MYHQVIELDALSTGYKKRGSERVISQKLDLLVGAGELVMLMGPNGCGKSTLMQTIAGLLPAISGRVRIAGHDLSRITGNGRAKLMSLVLTDKLASANLSVWDIVTTGRYPYVGHRGKLSEADRMCVERSLEQCRLGGMAHRLYAELSDGEKQRVMIARALAQETPVMLLDEPTAHLDLPSRLEVLMMLRSLARELDKSILVSTHELDLALQWADAIWLMDRGGRVVAGAPEDLVLTGDIERVFGGGQLHFDTTNGELRLVEVTSRPIAVCGAGLRLSWTCRAIRRIGYEPTIGVSEDPYIEVGEGSWRLHQPKVARSREFVSLYDLIGYMAQHELSIY